MGGGRGGRGMFEREREMGGAEAQEEMMAGGRRGRVSGEGSETKVKRELGGRAEVEGARRPAGGGGGGRENWEGGQKWRGRGGRRGGGGGAGGGHRDRGEEGGGRSTEIVEAHVELR